MRNAMDAEEVAVGWWPGDGRYERAAFYAYAHPAADGFSEATVEPKEARWESELGEYVLDWEDIRERDDPRGLALRVRQLRLSPRLRDVRVGRSPARERGGVTATGELSGPGHKRLHACPRGTPSHNEQKREAMPPSSPSHHVGSRRYGSGTTMMPRVANVPVPPDAL